MPITPKDIVDKVFTKSFRGYDEEEVDLFLDEVIKEMEKQMHENYTLRSKVDELTLKMGMLYASLQSQNGNMAQAQRKAQEYLDNTNIKARLIVEQAQRRARDIVAQAESEANERAAEAKAQSLKAIKDAEAESAKARTQMEREAIGLALTNTVADLRQKQMELELLNKKLERVKAELGAQPALEMEAGKPKLDFTVLDTPEESDIQPPMPLGYAIQSELGAVLEPAMIIELPSEEPVSAEEMPLTETSSAEERLLAAAIAELPSEEEPALTEESLMAEESATESDEASLISEAVEGDAHLLDEADEAALMELLPPGWDDLEALSDDELSLLMKALGIEFIEG